MILSLAVFEVAKELVCQFGTDDSEESCEQAMCPMVLALLNLDDVPLVSEPLCAVVCEE